MEKKLFELLNEINTRPRPFEYYTAEELWTNEHTSARMLRYHLCEDNDLASRRMAFIDTSVEWITNRFGIDQGTRIVDFGCGPGLYTNRFARSGAVVTGIDFSARSIAHAHQAAADQGLNVAYINRNYLEYEPAGEFDLITMIFCDFCVLSPRQRSRLLHTFSTHLVPGGSIVFDVMSAAGFSKREESSSYELNQLNGFWAREDYYGFLNTFTYENEMVSLDKYTIVRPYRHDVVYNWLQYFTPETLGAELAAHGLAIVEKYANVAGEEFSPDSDSFAVVVRHTDT